MKIGLTGEITTKKHHYTVAVGWGITALDGGTWRDYIFRPVWRKASKPTGEFVGVQAGLYVLGFYLIAQVLEMAALV